MYSDGWRLIAIYEKQMFWEKNFETPSQNASAPVIPPTESEIEKEGLNYEQKIQIDGLILKAKQDPEYWKEIREQALSELTIDQRDSPVVESLLNIRIRSIIWSKILQ